VPISGTHDRDDLAVVARTYPDELGKLIDQNPKIVVIMGDGERARRVWASPKGGLGR
jgi:hypothetical protein